MWNDPELFFLHVNVDGTPYQPPAWTYVLSLAVGLTSITIALCLGG